MEGLTAALGRLRALLRSAIRACAVMRRLAHGWNCRGRHARPARLPRQDVRRVRLVVLFQSTLCWPSESEHRPKARRSTTETCASSRFGTQQHYLGCYVNSHPANWSVDFRRFCEIALMGLKTHYSGEAATALAQLVHLLVTETDATGSSPRCPSKRYHIPVS